MININYSFKQLKHKIVIVIVIRSEKCGSLLILEVLL
jgi:hypothetical protein